MTLLELNDQYIELPTVPSTMEQLFANVQQAVTEFGKLPLDKLLDKLLAIFTRVDDILAAPEMDSALANLGKSLESIRQVLDTASAHTPRLFKKLDGIEDEAIATLRAARAFLQDTQKLVRHVDGQIAPLTGSATDTLVAARGALRQGQKTLANLENAATPTLNQAKRALAAVTDVVGADSVVLNDLSATLREIERAARSLRVLADMLERTPEALLRGKSR